MSESPASARRVVRFGVFELDLHAGELRKAGVRLSLPAQSFQVLALLLERPGDLVTREELRRRLWPTGTFVDFEHGLNAVVNRLRETLGDSADRPRFIETVPRRGYRFVARLETPPPVATPAPPAVPSRSGRWPSRPTIAGWAVLAALIVAVWSWQRSATSGAKPLQVSALTTLDGIEDAPTFSPDGQQVAFTYKRDNADSNDIFVTIVGSSVVRQITANPAEDYAPAWSPDGRQIAFLRATAEGSHIHVTSPLGGADLEVSEFVVGSPTTWWPTSSKIAWSPDGRSIAASHGRLDTGDAGIYLIPLNGGEARRITHPPGSGVDYSPAYSPDGRRLAYASCSRSGPHSPFGCDVFITEVDATFAPTGSARKVTTQALAQLDGLTWTRDGRSLVFFGFVEGPVATYLWRVGAAGGAPERIEVAGPYAVQPAASAAGDRLAFSRWEWDNHIYRFQQAGRHERVLASSFTDGDPQFSPDGRRIAFASARSGAIEIWVSQEDGSEPYQLTHRPGIWQGSPHWSPDGRTIAFDSQAPSDGRFHIWTIQARGGSPRQVTNDPGDQTVPTWSRDGESLYFSAGSSTRRDIWRRRLATGAVQRITHAGAGLLAIETADGQSLIYQRRLGDAPLLRLALNGGAEAEAMAEVVVECVRPAAFDVGSYGLMYVPCAGGSNPQLRAVKGNTARVVGTLENFQPQSPPVNLAVSPDGNTVLYVRIARRGADLFLIENFR